jgi:hypothetical protein
MTISQMKVQASTANNRTTHYGHPPNSLRSSLGGGDLLCAGSRSTANERTSTPAQRLADPGHALGLSSGPALADGSSGAVAGLKNIRFSPSRVVVVRGQSVTWEFLNASILMSHKRHQRGPASMNGEVIVS